MIKDDVFIGKNVQRLEDNMLAFSPSRQWEIKQVTFTEGNLDTEVLHSLQTAHPAKVRYQVVQAVTPLLVFHDPLLAWAEGVIYLRSSGPGTARIMLWLDDEENTEEPLAALNEWGETPEIELEATNIFGTTVTLGTQVGSATVLDGALGPGVEMKTSIPAYGFGHWSVAGNVNGTFPELKVQDHQNGFTPFQIRRDSILGAYAVMPGPNTAISTSGSGGVYLGTTTDGVNRGKFRGAWLQEGIGTYGRTAFDGVWVDYTPTYATTGPGTWTGHNVTTMAYTIVGKTMTLSFYLDSSNVGGVASSALTITLPSGVTAAKTVLQNFVHNDAGAGNATGFMQVLAGGSVLSLYKLSITNWTITAANNTNVFGTITFPIS